MMTFLVSECPTADGPLRRLSRARRQCIQPRRFGHDRGIARSFSE
jgi:hypothetical protein